MYVATAAAWMSSSSLIGSSSPLSAADATISVGARSSFSACSAPAASFRRSSERGPRTRKRHGLVSPWFGAQRASSRVSASVRPSTGSRPKTFCVRRVRIASGLHCGRIARSGRWACGGDHAPQLARRPTRPEPVPADRRVLSFERLAVSDLHAWAVRTLPHVHSDPFDPLLVAQARCQRAAIVSADIVFDDYGVQRIW